VASIGRGALVEQLRGLGVEPGMVLLVHTSFSEVGPVEGGPDALIEALLEVLGPDGTLVMPSWTDEDDQPFDPASPSARAHLGIVADVFWRRPDVLRGGHVFAMAARGPRAEYITGAPLVLPPHAQDSGVARVHELDGWVLLLGVDHDANTTIHLAEALAGVPYRVPKYCTILRDGQPARVDYGEIDHCCQNFTLAGEWLTERGLERRGRLGHATARLSRCSDVVDVVVPELRADAGGGGCEGGARGGGGGTAAAAGGGGGGEGRAAGAGARRRRAT
jgi:aminoglycoside N3'-acetyltransferase